VIYHIVALIVGYVIDLIVGDPYKLPHPIRLIGKLISKLDKALLGDVTNHDIKKERIKGALLWACVVMSTGVATAILLIGAYLINPYLGVVVEAILSAYTLATKSLRVESMKVYYALKNEGLDRARYAVSMIVGRDTLVLDEVGVAKATVETIAENTSDGVIAPLIYNCLGGPIAGMIYKAINTMDSMIGYHNDRYEYFGSFAAKCDDIVNFIPARLSALYMIAASFFLGKNYDTKNAILIFKRDRFNHKSPNSAQTESVCAGALSLELAGDAYYFGKLLSKKTIGDPIKQIESEDIRRANRLMYMTSFIGLILSVLFLVFFLLIV